MLTLAKIKLFQEFHSDLDGWTRARRSRPDCGMTDADWYLLDELRSALFLISTGKTSPEFRHNLEKRLVSCTDSEETRQAFWEMAN